MNSLLFSLRQKRSVKYFTFDDSTRGWDIGTWMPEDDAVGILQAHRKRDSLSSRIDFYAQPEYPSDTEGLEAVKTYRQALRDIHEQSSFPRQIEA